MRRGADPLADLTDTERRALIELARERASEYVDRRGVVKGAGLFGAGALFGSFAAPSVGDADAQTTCTTPTPTDTGAGGGGGGGGTSTETQSTTPTATATPTPTPEAETSSANSIRVVFDGGVESIDPGAVSDPVTQAYATINANGGAGAIYLPPGRITDDGGDITEFSSTRLIGHGIGPSTVEFTNTEFPAFRSVDGISTQFSYFDGVRFDGSDIAARQASTNANATSCFHFEAAPNWHPQQVNMGIVRFKNWGDRTIWFDGSAPFDSRWGAISFGFGRNAGTHIWSDNGGMVDIGYLSGGASDGHAVLRNQINGTKWTIGQLNVGGAAARAINNRNTANGLISVRRINFEPGDDSNAVEAVRTRNNFVCPYISLTHIDVKQAIGLGYHSGGNVIGSVRLTGRSSVENGRLNVDREPDGESWYYGPASDIAVTHDGATNGLVRALADAGKGVG